MDHRTLIQDSLDMIEANLQTDLTAAELAKQAGFSVYHYYRLFQKHTGFPVIQYILRRRLLHAIYEIRSGRTRIDAALDYGFDTYAGFYKAFRREFGCTPSEYLKKNRAKRPYNVDLQKEDTMNLTHVQAREVLKHWNMENETISDLYYESSGNKAANAVCVGEYFVLKRAREPAGIRANQELAHVLKDAGVGTQEPVPAETGQICVECSGWFYWLYRRAQGKAITSASLYGEGGATKARFVGEVIGQLHLAMQKSQTEGKEADLLETVQNWALPKAKEILHLPDEFCQSYLQNFQRLYPVLPRQLIHRDPNPGNILTADDRWSVIDFDLAERNIRLFDPCYAATAVLSESFETADEQKRNEWFAILRNILWGYDSVIHLTQQERQAVPCVLLANQFVCVAWFSSQPQFAELAEINQRMTLWMIDHLHEAGI